MDELMMITAYIFFGVAVVFTALKGLVILGEKTEREFFLKQDRRFYPFAILLLIIVVIAKYIAT